MISDFEFEIKRISYFVYELKLLSTDVENNHFDTINNISFHCLSNTGMNNL